MKPLMRVIIIGLALASIFVFLVVSHNKNVDNGVSDGSAIIFSQ